MLGDEGAARVDAAGLWIPDDGDGGCINRKTTGLSAFEDAVGTVVSLFTECSDDGTKLQGVLQEGHRPSDEGP